MNFVVEGIMVPIISGFGLAGNVASLIVLRSPQLDMKVSFRHILMMLALFDSFFVLFTVISFSFEQISQEWKTSYQNIFFPKLLPIIQISLTGSIWSTVSVAVERFLSVVKPNSWIAKLSSKVYIIPVLTISFLWNIPRFFELRTCYYISGNITEMPEFLQESLGNTSSLNVTAMANQITFDKHIPNITNQYPALCPNPIRSDPLYLRYYILLANFFMMGLLPFIILAVTNLLLYRTIKSAGAMMSRATARQKRDQNIAMILVLIVVVFVCCNSIRMILNLYEVFQAMFVGEGALDDWPLWCEVLTLVSHLLLVLNSSTNILIYCWKDKKFRAQLLKFLGGKSVMRTKTLIMNTLPSAMTKRTSPNSLPNIPQ